MRKFFVILLLFFSYFAYSQNNIYRSGGISQTIGPPTYTPGTGGNVVAIDTVTGEWYVNPNRLSGASWLSAGYRLTNISGSVSPLYTPTKFQSRLVINAVDSIYYYNGSAWKHVNKAGGPAGGDLSGTYPNPTVSKIQGRFVSSTAPSNGQVLTWNNGTSVWQPATVADQSATNELQTIDTFSLSGQTLSASLSSDNQPAKTVTLPIIDVVAGTNVTVSKTNGVATVSAIGGITSLNGLTASTQTFATGTTGTDFNIASATSTHTFNLPTASATNRGLLSSANWTTFNNKVGGTGAASKVAFFTDAGTLSNNTNFHWDNSNSRLGIGVTSPTSPLSVLGAIRSEVSGASCSFTAYNPLTGYPRSVFIIGNSASDNNVGLQVSPAFGTKPTVLDVAINQNVNDSNNRFLSLYMTSTIGYIVSTQSQGNSGGNQLQIGTNVPGSQQGIVIGTVANGQNVGIGNTSLSARLHVQGGNNTSNTYSFIATNSGGSTTTPAICAQNDQKVGIGTNSVDSGATLEVDGTTGGILFPRLTTTQRDALTPTNGLMIYNTTTSKFQGYAGGAWVDLH